MCCFQFNEIVLSSFRRMRTVFPRNRNHPEMWAFYKPNKKSMDDRTFLLMDATCLHAIWFYPLYQWFSFQWLFSWFWMKLEALNQVHIKWFINLSYFIIQILRVTLQLDTLIQGCHFKNWMLLRPKTLEKMSPVKFI